MNRLTAEMILIPAGEFTMGSPSGQGDADEHPQHKVFVDEFYMDKYEVTNRQYKKFCEATSTPYPSNSYLTPIPYPFPYANPDWDVPESPEQYYLDKPDSPVIGVTWADAVAYAKWAGKRLPTEAEWEYTCRAGTSTKYNIGDKISHDDANYNGAWGKDQWNMDPATVGSFPPNAWGLYDMHGNVMEWCSDWYGNDYYSRSPSDNPKGPMPGMEGPIVWQDKVVRGGSWRYGADDLRSASRFFYPIDRRNTVIGFRCALDTED